MLEHLTIVSTTPPAKKSPILERVSIMDYYDKGNAEKEMLSATVTKEMLNNLMLLYVYEVLMNTSSLANVSNEFVSKSKSRLQVFDKF